MSGEQEARPRPRRRARAREGVGLDRASVVGLGALALVARLPGLGRSLWYDELFTLSRFARSPGDALLAQAAANNHPPASLLAWGARLVTETEVGLRAPFAVAGALAVAALAWAVSVGAGRRAGLVAGALAVLAPAHVLASQQVRGYPLMLLAAALLLGCFTRVVRLREGEPAPRLAFAGLVVSAGFGLWSHATLLAAILPLAGVALFAARLGASKRGARLCVGGLTGGLALGLLLLAPILGRTFKFVWGALGVSEASGASPGALGLSDLVALLSEERLLGAALGGLVSVGLVVTLRSPRRRLLGLTYLAAPAALLALLLLRPLGYARFALFALPSLLALVACGLTALLRRRRWLVVALGLLLLCSALQVRAGASREHQDLRGAMALARERAAHLGDALLIGLGPGGELLSAYAPEAQADPTGDLSRGALRAGRPVVCVVPLPGWLAQAPGLRALLWSDAFSDPVAFPGREQSVLVFATRTPAGR